MGNLDDAAAQEADERGARWQGFITDWWRQHGEEAVTPGALIDMAFGFSIIRESKDGDPEAKARGAATRLGLALTRQVGKVFKVKLDDDVPACIIALTRAKADRAKGGSHPGFALKPAEKTALKVGNVGEGPENAISPRKTKENFSASVPANLDDGLTNVGGALTPEKNGESQNPPTLPTFDDELDLYPDGDATDDEERDR